MTLREEFEKEVKINKGGISVLFETSNQHYIEWLEAKIQALSQHDVIKNEVAVCDCKKYGIQPARMCSAKNCVNKLDQC